MLVCLSLLALTGCPAASAEAGEVRVGVYDYHPLTGVDPENPEDIGILTELLAYVARKEGWRIRHVPGTLEECLSRLESGEIDLLVSVPYSNDTSHRFHFTREPVIPTWAQVFTGGGKKIHSPLDLRDLDVGLVKDDPYNEELRSLCRSLDVACTFVEFPHYDDVFAAIENGWVDAGLVDRLYGDRHLPDGSIKKTPVMFSPMDYRYAAPKAAGENLISALDYHLESLKADPRSLYYDLLDRIFHRSRHPYVLKYVWWAVVLLFGGLILVGGMNLLLRQQVRSRTHALSAKNEELEAEVRRRFKAEAKLREQKFYLTALNETTLGVIRRLELDELLEIIIHRAAELVSVRNGFIYLFNRRENVLEERVGIGRFAPHVGLRRNPGEGVVWKAYAAGKPMVIHDYAQWEGRMADAGYDWIRSIIVVPLPTGKNMAGGVVGLVHETEKGWFGEEERDILERFAELASIALNNSVMYDRLASELEQRKQAETRLRESWSRMKQVLDSLQSGVFVIDAETDEIVDTNPAAARMADVDSGRLIGRNAGEVIRDHPPFSGPDMEDVLHPPHSGGSGHGGLLPDGILPRSSERTLETGTGQGVPILETVVCCELNGREYRVSNFIDLSRLKEAERQRRTLEIQLRESQKREAIGTLAGGIAHDFNNILSPIIGYTEMTLDGVPEDSPMARNLRAVLEGADRAAQLVRQILAFSRNTEGKREFLIVQPVVKEALKLLRSSIPSNIEMEWRISDRCGPVLGDPSQIHQIVMNLCTNAYHAVEDRGGTVEVRLDEVETAPRRASLRRGDGDDGGPAVDNPRHPNADGPPGPISLVKSAGVKSWERRTFVRLAVSDSGVGIEPSILDRIFDPYFTTKEREKGSGLGLAVVHGIVQSHGGWIRVETQPENGTTFEIYFPRSDRRPESEEKPRADIELAAGNEHVLIVDDEGPIVEMERILLERLGYRVTAFTESPRALAHFRSAPDRFDLIITDQSMPRLTGDKLTKEVLSIRPDMPVILCSGFSETIEAQGLRSLGIRRFIAKPVKIEQFASAVREVLNEGGRQAPVAACGTGDC